LNGKGICKSTPKFWKVVGANSTSSQNRLVYTQPKALCKKKGKACENTLPIMPSEGLEKLRFIFSFPPSLN
ncbi:MAG: hypothetical protein JJU02_16520, partial [Cryomorphaceae bacterium]|nr:hypothetical protein [Cryomorphaceae bacterium]